MKMAALAIVILPLSILGFSAVGVVVPPGVNAIANPGPHGLSEILYAFSSQTGNNGSAFAGLGSTTVGNPSFVFYNWTGPVAMIIGRFAFLRPIPPPAGPPGAKQVLTP